jgi:rhomboid protease GluP
MLRQKWGSVVCPSCGNLVGVNDEKCFTCGRWNPGMWGFAPLLNRLGRDLGFTQLVMGACIVIYGLMLITDPYGIRNDVARLTLLAPSGDSMLLFGISGRVPVLGLHWWWTLITASWLHGSMVHILFNLMALRQLAPPASEMYGAGRMVIVYTLSGVTGFLTSTLAGTDFTLGASASLCGLLGALLYYGKRSGSSMVSTQAKSWMLSLVLFGFFMPGIDNWAHAGGFAGGYVVSRFLDPLHPERLDHLIAAVACLVVTGIAIVFSIVHGLRFVG